MPGLSKVIVLDPDMRAGRQVQLGFEREGVPAEAVAADPATLELPGDDAGLLVIGGVDGQALELVRRSRALLAHRNLDAPIVFAGRGVRRSEVEAAGADEVVRQPAYLRDVVTIGRLLRGVPSAQRGHLVGSLVETTHVLALVRALAALGRSAMLTLVRGLRRGEIRFYHGEVTSAQVGLIHGQAALHHLLLWTDARFDFHHEDVVRRQQIPLSHAELFADAERFLEGVRDSSGGVSPSVVLQQDLQRIQALGKQIPTEVYGVLRMFDGHRMLADVLEDSPYRVFETLRVAQRAVEAGLLRPVDVQPGRVTWRSSTAIEEWLIGSASRTRAPGASDAPGESGASDAPGASDAGDEHDGSDAPDPGDAPDAADERDASPATAAGPVRDPTAGARDGRARARKPRRKKKKRTQTPVAQPGAPAGAGQVPPAAGQVPPAAASTAQQPAIDWGSLVPRVVGADVTPLSGVVPSAQLSGEIIAATRPIAGAEPGAEPSIVFDENASDSEAAQGPTDQMPAVTDAEAAQAATDQMPAVTDAEAAQGPTDQMPAVTDVEAAQAPTDQMPAVTDAEAARGPTDQLPAVTSAGAPDEPGQVMDDLRLDDTKPERRGSRPDARTTGVAIAESATTEPIAVPPVADIVDPAAPEGTDAEPTAPRVLAHAPAPGRAERPRRAEREAEVMPAEPAEIEDAPSDGVVREHIATADTTPVKRRRLPSDPPVDDRPEFTSGEITMPRARPVERRRSEPTILVGDLAAVHAAVSEIASDQVTVPVADAASPSLAARVSDLRDDAAAFSEIEEAFFRAGHEKEAVAARPATAESFEDLDRDYQPVGFWNRLRGKPASAAPADAAPADAAPADAAPADTAHEDARHGDAAPADEPARRK